MCPEHCSSHGDTIMTVPLLVATGSKKDLIEPTAVHWPQTTQKEAQGCFLLLREPENYNCSLFIRDTRKRAKEDAS